MEDYMQQYDKSREVVQQKFTQYGFSFSQLTSTLQSHFINFEIYYDNLCKEAENAKRLLKGNQLSMQAVAAKLNVTRQALYNHPILLQYITQRTAEFKERYVNGCSNGCEIIDSLKTELNAYKEHEIELLNLKQKNAYLEEKIQSLTSGSAYSQLKKENGDLKIEILTLQQQLSEYEDNIENNAKHSMSSIWN